MDHRPLNPARLKGVLVATLVAILVAGLLPTAALAGHNPNDADPCDGAPSASGDFADYDRARETHRPSIDCALYRRITSGAGTNEAGEQIYRPLRAVNRAQMAQFIVNTLVAAGYDEQLPNGQGRDEFDDISDNFARVAINRLAKANIVRGTGGNSYTPGGTVTRQQMASFIVQAARFAVGEDHPVERDDVDRFRDVSEDNPHKDNIEAGADADLFRGTGATTFEPGARVLRDQMATFLVNLLNYTFNPDQAPPPNDAEVSLAATTVAAGETLSGDINGNNIQSASVDGCGLDDAELSDADNSAEGIQFEVTIPAEQDAGECTLTFMVTFDNNAVRTFDETITVTADNNAAVTVTDDTVSPGDAVEGEITGNNIESAVVSGCGLTNEEVEDQDTNKAGIQFSESIPATQQVGSCELTFTVTYSDEETEELDPVALNIVERTGVTTQPELVGAEIVSTTSSGTTVRYLFDEPVTGANAPNAGRFFLYAFDASREAGSSAIVESGNTRAVRVTFPNITTTDEVEDYTVAAVQAEAVQDDQGERNPEGNVPVGTQRDETIRQPGATAAPDLVSVGAFRTASEGNTAVDFTFDEAAYVVNPDGFHLVMNDGTLVNCEGPEPDATEPGGGTDAGGNGTTTITAVCPDPAGEGDSTTPISATNTARGYVDAETVSDVEQDVSTINDTPEGNTNPLQAAVVGDSGETPVPDLVSAEFTPGEGDADDQVVYTFDQVIRPLASDNLAGEPTNLFRVYDTTGAEEEATDAERGSDTTTVVATFPSGTLTDAVGASVRAGAVVAATGDSSGQPNRADEVGVTNSTTRTITPGRTAGPDLLTVELDPEEGTATYTFDEEVNSSSVDPTDFYLWLSDGTRLTCFAPLPGMVTVEDSSVTCSTYQQGNSQASDEAVGSAVLGTVASGAVDDAESGETTNPEGAAPTTGGTGEPEN